MKELDTLANAAARALVDAPLDALELLRDAHVLAVRGRDMRAAAMLSLYMARAWARANNPLRSVAVAISMCRRAAREFPGDPKLDGLEQLASLYEEAARASAARGRNRRARTFSWGQPLLTRVHSSAMVVNGIGAWRKRC